MSYKPIGSNSKQQKNIITQESFITLYLVSKSVLYQPI